MTNSLPWAYKAYFYRTVSLPSDPPPAVAAPGLSDLRVLHPGTVRFQLNSVAGTSWRVEGSPDAVHWGNYGVVSNPTGVFLVTNKPAFAPMTYFYRVVQPSP